MDLRGASRMHTPHSRSPHTKESTTTSQPRHSRLKQAESTKPGEHQSIEPALRLPEVRRTLRAEPKGTSHYLRGPTKANPSTIPADASRFCTVHSRREMTTLPSGTVTFVFTDIEASTRRWQADPDAMQQALHKHDALLEEAVASHDGFMFKHTGDGMCASFASPRAAVTAAAAIQRALS